MDNDQYLRKLEEANKQLEEANIENQINKQNLDKMKDALAYILAQFYMREYNYNFDTNQKAHGNKMSNELFESVLKETEFVFAPIIRSLKPKNRYLFYTIEDDKVLKRMIEIVDKLEKDTL